MAFQTRAPVLLLALAALLPLAGGCSDDLMIPDFNNTSLEDLVERPTPAAAATVATGLLVGARESVAARNGYVSLLGVLGRESYNFDAADPRFVTEMLEGPLVPSSPAFGGNLWNQRYRTLRAASLLLAATDELVGWSDEEKSATRGFTKTMMAHELLMVINTRDTNGAVIDVARSLDEEPGAIVSREETLAEVMRLLDEGALELAAGGGTFPFPLSSGFQLGTGGVELSTPPTFLLFNRALAARTEAYRENWEAVLAALEGSFVSTEEPLANGAYHVFTTGSGDATNPLFDPAADVLLAHPKLVRDAEEGDLRLSKLRELESARRVRGIETRYAFDLYSTLTTPVPIIRNEELILLRAEANIGLGRIGEAAEDINFIRTSAGGVGARGDLNAGNILDELLHQRRYSLMFEGGHRWIDLRRYDRLDDPDLLDLPSHRVNARFPIPEAECLARSQPSGPCA